MAPSGVILSNCFGVTFEKAPPVSNASQWPALSSWMFVSFPEGSIRITPWLEKTK